MKNPYFQEAIVVMRDIKNIGYKRYMETVVVVLGSIYAVFLAGVLAVNSYFF